MMGTQDPTHNTAILRSVFPSSKSSSLATRQEDARCESIEFRRARLGRQRSGISSATVTRTKKRQNDVGKELHGQELGCCQPGREDHALRAGEEAPCVHGGEIHRGGRCGGAGTVLEERCQGTRCEFGCLLVETAAACHTLVFVVGLLFAFAGLDANQQGRHRLPCQLRSSRAASFVGGIASHDSDRRRQLEALLPKSHANS